MRRLTAPLIGVLIGTIVAWMGIPTVDAWLDVVIPAKRWFEVRDIRVANARVDQSPAMVVDRVIHKPFTANWTVSLRRETEDGYALFCARHGRNDYRVGSTLPKGLDLEWWMDIPANPRCPAIPPGRYIVTVAWTLEIPGLEPKTVRAASNVFEVRA